MSENCTHDCSSCGADCPSRNAPESLQAPQNAFSHVKKVIGVVSGKGGVGKSMVSSMLAVLSRRKGMDTAILDADITGPSIPKAFGIHEPLMSSDEGIYPAVTSTGIRMISLNLMLESETDPVIWRGPVIAGAVKQFWTDVMWGDVDVMYVDMPPGTGDVPLTVFQSLPLDGIVIVTTPQDLVGMIVEKACRMAEMMNIPVVGIVENMAYYICDNCGKRHYLFGKTEPEKIAERFHTDICAEIPVHPTLTAAFDAGSVEVCEMPWLDRLVDAILQLPGGGAR
ncbi:MAG: Mrp/NBP35 family ATP-binding protein [Clostridia bacterium]|nr:Mrp/NBP35 family ATP-binding protein [Clostridia bacterium]